MRSRRDLAAIVERRRHDRGMSQAELADRAGVSRQWVISVEAAEGNPSFTNLVALLDVLGLEIDVVEQTEAGRHTPDFPNLDDIVNRHRGPSPERRR